MSEVVPPIPERKHPIDIELQEFVDHTLDLMADLLVALHLDTCGLCRMKWVRLHRARHDGRDPDTREYESSGAPKDADKAKNLGFIPERNGG